MLELMRQLAREGMTMVVVTHEMGFAREVATRVLFMDEGRIVEQAPPETFFTHPENPRLQDFCQRCCDLTALYLFWYSFLMARIN